MMRKQICVRIRVDLNTKLMLIAQENDVSKNKLIERALRQFAERYNSGEIGAGVWERSESRFAER